MSKVTLKTSANDASVEQFLAGVADHGRRDDCRAVMDMMARITGGPPAMWGSSIIGFGRCQLRYDSGRGGARTADRRFGRLDAAPARLIGRPSHVESWS